MTINFGMAVIATTAYNDGAGATAVYTYALAVATKTVLDSSMWIPTSFAWANPTEDFVTPAASRTVTGGAPPAANLRSFAVSTSGIYAFADNHEVLSNVRLAVTCLTTGEQIYDKFTIGGYKLDTYATMSAITNVGALWSAVPDAVIDTHANVWGATTDWLAVEVVPSADALTAQLITPGVGIYTGDDDLFTRAYTGEWIQGLGQFGFAGVLLSAKRVEPAIAMVVNYLIDGKKAWAIDMPLRHYTAALGAGI